MPTIEEKFAALATEHAPGQEVRQAIGNIDNLMRGDMLAGTPVDFSHGDVDAFTPTPGAFEAFADAVTAAREGGVEGKSVSVRVDIGGRRIIKQKQQHKIQ